MAEVPLGIAVLTVPDLTVVFNNRVYESWFQVERRPILGKRLADLLATAPQVLPTFHEVAATGGAAHFHNAEFVGVKDRPVVLPGDLSLWDWSIWPVKAEGGPVTHLLVTGLDVTAAVADRRRVDQAHEEGLRGVLEISRAAGTAGSLEDFFGELSSTVARLVGARAVLFARAADGSLVAQLHSHGLPDDLLAPLAVPCGPEGEGIIDRVVFKDEVFRAVIDANPEYEPYRPAIEALGISDALAVAWRAGDLRLGLVAALDSKRPGGFSDEDVHMLKTVSMAAGVVWQFRETQERLARAQRLESERLRALAESSRALERAKADFLRLASHEMRGPLTVALGYLSMLLDGSIGELSAQTRGGLEIVAGKIEEMGRMVDQMLDAARVEDRSLVLDIGSFDIQDCVRSAVAEARKRATPAHTLVSEPGPAIPVRADAKRVGIILANLLGNAIKYSPEGGEIRCRVRHAGGAVEVLVSDQGVGIEDVDLPRLFTRFTRVGDPLASAAIPGTGLGLYLSREAARLHGGDLTVSSRPGQGSEFTLRLPAG